MADGDNITVKQFQDFVDKADERLDNLEFGKADRVSPVSITIPVSAWVENTDNDALAAGFAYCASVIVDGLTDDDAGDTIPAFSSFATVKSCGMAERAKHTGNTMKYYAVQMPDADIVATVRISVQQNKEG